LNVEDVFQIAVARRGGRNGLGVMWWQSSYRVRDLYARVHPPVTHLDNFPPTAGAQRPRGQTPAHINHRIQRMARAL
jgi:hypothetical protein